MSWRFLVLHYLDYFNPVLNTQIVYIFQLQVSLKKPNFLFWRCCPQEHLAAFPYACMKNKYWNTKMKRSMDLFMQIYTLIFGTAGSLHPSKQRGLSIALDLKKTTHTPPPKNKTVQNS